MQFFLYEIVARIVAIYLCFDCYRRIRSGLLERKITYYFTNNDILDWLFFSPSNWVAQRDTAPVRYWIVIGLQIVTLVACLVVAIFGWWHPET
jgi:hypothetical protein